MLRNHRSHWLPLFLTKAETYGVPRPDPAPKAWGVLPSASQQPCEVLLLFSLAEV